MKNLDLNAMGVNEMNEVEMKQTEGGLLPIFWFLIGMVASELQDRNSGRDFAEGYAAAMQ